MRRLFLIPLLTVLTPWASAQRMAVASSHFAGIYRHGGHARASLNPLAFYDYYGLFPGEEYSSAVQPLIVVQPPPPAPPAPVPAEPLLMELQGDRYIRVIGSGAKQVETINSSPAPSHVQNSLRAAAAQPTAVILFRDGHREEISNYTIAGGVLYTTADYYATGSWTRRIDLSSLNLSATLESNQARGTKFRLPSSPNEVIIGP